MDYYVIHEEISLKHNYNAISKARKDVESIIVGMGGKGIKICDSDIPDRDKRNIISKFMIHRVVSKMWIKQMECIEPNSTVIIQFPVIMHTIFFDKVVRYLHKKKCCVIALIHDLETLRLAKGKSKNFLKNHKFLEEEKRTLPLFDSIVAHNTIMKKEIVNRFGVAEKKIEVLSIFDCFLQVLFA